jgi:cytidyltransferase-like protein
MQFVSGCYDVLHAGHLQFFRDAKALGDYLTVSFASSEACPQIIASIPPYLQIWTIYTT